MNSFEYIRPSTLAEAVTAWTPASAYLGGGTNLVDLMKTGALRPSRLIDINRLPGLDRIETLAGGDTRIGALVSNADLAADASIARMYPMLAESVLAGASGQLRNAATVGGNLLQHTRCAYFQDPHSACNRRTSGSGCSARGGENANMAILGWSEHCIATNPSDMLVALAALNAVVEVEGAQGRKDIALAQFHRLPDTEPHRETALSPGDIVVALRIPAASAAFQQNSRYLKVRERTSFAFALVSVAAGLRLDKGRIASARLALGAVAARPWRKPSAEALLAGQVPDAALFGRVADELLQGARASGENAYKIGLARRAVVRALQMAAAGTPAHVPASPFGDADHA